MVHDSFFLDTVKEIPSRNDFDAAARAHLKSLEDAGEPPEQIIRQLADVVASYATGGLDDEAKALREIIRQYQMRRAKDGTRLS